MSDAKKEVCRVMITFPLVDNQTALAVKDSLDKMFNSIPDSAIQFSIMPIPAARPSMQVSQSKTT